MQVMKEQESKKTLEQRVEMDDAYIGGERPGKVGRGAEGKTPFIAAVETDTDGKPQRIALQVVTGFTSAEVAAFAKAKLASSCEVISDGLACFRAVTDQGCSHSSIVTGGGRKSVEKPAFKWVNTSLGNIKSALTGTYRQQASKHIPRYLAEVEYRLNRRHDRAGMLTRLAWVSLRTPPMPYHLIKLAESHA